MKRILSYFIYLYFRLAFIRQILWSVIIFCFFIVMAALFFRGGELETSPVGWEKTFLVSSYQITARNVNVTSKGNFILAVYEARRDNVSGLYTSMSFNGGDSFLPPVRVAATDYNIEKKPCAAVSGSGKIAVTWHDYVERDSANRIFLATSDDMGATWSRPVQVPFGQEMEILPMVYYDDRDRLHLFYHGLKEGNFNLYHSVAGNENVFKTSDSLINLKERMKGAFFPAICFSGSNIFIVWQVRGTDFRDDLYFIKSSNYGMTWGWADKIIKSPGSNIAPSIVLYKETLYVAYQNNDEKAWSIKLIAGKDFGKKWDDQKPLLISSTPANCYSPKIARSGNKLYIAWYDEREKLAQIYSRNLNLSDGALSAEVKLSQRDIPSINPLLVYSGKKIVALWEEKGRVMAKYSDEDVPSPVVYSRSNPENSWSRSSSAVIEWKQPQDESGIAGFVTVVNKLPEFNPPDIVNTKSNASRKVLANLEDGVNYFHIKTIDGAGNTSRTVHYKIQVSSTPPPMPLVFSPTHKEGVDTASASPVFRWAVDDTDRVKGFYYGVAKDGIATPDIYTSSFELKFDDMEEGGYFFSISSVDKTNQIGPPATYYFIVGHAEQIDIEKIKNIAKQSIIQQKRVIVAQPVVNIIFPFNTSDFFTASSFTARIKVANIPAEHIAGFAFVNGTTAQAIPERVGITEPLIHLANLADGEYYLGVKCRYFREVRGKLKYFWTKPVYRSFRIELPSERDPFEYIIADLLEKISRKSLLLSLMVLFATGITMVFGFGSRVVFYTRLMQFKFITIFRIMIG